MQDRSPQNAQGIDVSFAQGVVEWPRVKASGKVFALARATAYATPRPHRGPIVDQQFDRNWRGMLDTGLMRAAYHYAVPGETSSDPATDAKQQAAMFAHTVLQAGGFRRGDLGAVLDFENNDYRLSPATLESWALAHFAELQALLGDIAHYLYGPFDFLNSLPPGPLSQVPLWSGWINPGPPPDMRQWHHWTALQYSWQGRVDGIAGPVDLDEWCLPAQDLARLVGFGEQPAAQKILLAESPILQPIGRDLARQYGWVFATSIDAAKGASAVVCVGGTLQFIAQAKQVAGAAWHEPLAGTDLWLTLQKVGAAGQTGRF